MSDGNISFSFHGPCTRGRDQWAWHRYELEKELMEGSVKVNDLPRIWNERMAAYLGCTPKDDAQGVLQASKSPCCSFGLLD